MAHRLRRRYGRASARDPMTAFKAAARKIGTAIAHLEQGGDIASTSWTREVATVFNTINKLDDRANRPEIRGDDKLREEAWEIVRGFRERTRAAEPIGFELRKTRR